MSGGLTRRSAITAVGGTAALGGLALNSTAALGAGSSAGSVGASSEGVIGKFNKWLPDDPLFNRENAAKVLAARASMRCWLAIHRAFIT